MAAGNLVFFKDKLCDEGQRKEEEGGGVVLALAPWVNRLPPAMRLSFDDWAMKKVSDMRACYAAFFLGSGRPPRQDAASCVRSCLFVLQEPPRGLPRAPRASPPAHLRPRRKRCPRRLLVHRS